MTMLTNGTPTSLRSTRFAIEQVNLKERIIVKLICKSTKGTIKNLNINLKHSGADVIDKYKGTLTRFSNQWNFCHKPRPILGERTMRQAL